MKMVWYRFRAELRTRWRAWVGLGLLVGVAAAAVMALAAGARRTDSAYSRFAHWAHGEDAGAECSLGGASVDESGACDVDRLRRLPQVAAAAAADMWGPGSVVVHTSDGRPAQVDPQDSGYTGPGELSVIAPADRQFGKKVQRLKIVDGRLPRADHPDEAAVNFALADRLGLDVGDRLRLSFRSDEDDERVPARKTVRIVGIEVAPFEIPPPSGHWFAGIHLSRAFHREAVAKGLTRARGRSSVAIRLRDGATAVDLEQAVAQRGLPFEVQGFEEIGDAENIRRAIRPQATALWMIAALVALGGAAVLGQALVRATFLDSIDDGTLRALGMARRDFTKVAMARAVFIGGIAAALGALGALLASPLTPIGLARTIEPNPGFTVDPGALAIGVVVTLAFVGLAVGGAAWRASSVAGSRRAPNRRPSAAAALAARASLPPVAVTGVRLALEPGRGRTPVPVRSTLVGVTAGLVALSAALTFSGSLDRLLSTPRLSGWNWSFAVPIPYDDDGQGGSTPRVPLSRIEGAFTSHPGVEGVALGTLFRPFPTEDHALELGHERVPVDILTFAQGRVGPTVLRGAAPAAPDEILVGPDTLDDLGLDIGDTVRAVGRVGEFDDQSSLREVSARFRVVGVGVIPISGGPTRLGRGATLTLAGVQAMNPKAQPDVVWLRLAPGAPSLRVVRDVGRQLGLAEAETVRRRDLMGFQQSGEVLNVKQVDQLPLLLAGLMGILAAGVLAHVLLTGARARRRDLAILVTFGFVRRQIRGTVSVQATTLAVLAVVVGLPLGAVLGRVIWRSYAESIGVVPEPSVPVVWLMAVAIGTLLVANLVALVPARAAARTRPAVVLRSE